MFNGSKTTKKYPFVTCPGLEKKFQAKLTYSNPESQNLLLPVSQHKLIFVECKYPASLKIKYAKYNTIENVVRGLKGEIIKGELVPLTSKKEIFYNASNLIYES